MWAIFVLIMGSVYGWLPILNNTHVHFQSIGLGDISALFTEILLIFLPTAIYCYAFIYCNSGPRKRNIAKRHFPINIIGILAFGYLALCLAYIIAPFGYQSNGMLDFGPLFPIRIYAYFYLFITTPLLSLCLWSLFKQQRKDHSHKAWIPGYESPKTPRRQ